MTPDVSGTGHSFKSAFAYFLHDKGQDAAGERVTTAERVAWTETRNLATDHPHMAWRIMVQTAENADALKREAGIKATGRKAKGGPVYSYSLSWRGADEAEGLTREDMVRAAEQTLKILKYDHLQTVIVAHQDTANPHVHVVVNRVDPATGKTAPTPWKDFDRLSDWAARYERERGMIVTPKRQEAEQARQKAKEALKPEQAANRPRIDGDRRKTPPRADTPASRLKALGDQQKANHAAEREKFWTDQKARRQAVYAAAGQEIRDRAAAAKIENRPLWAALHRQQKAERWHYDQREKHIAGKVRNAIDAVTSRQIRGDGTDRGFLTMAFGYLASRDARRAEFDTRQRIERDRLSEQTKGRLDADIQRIKEARERTLADGRAAFTKESTAMKARQGREVADVRQQWKALYAERERAGAARTPEPRRDPSKVRLQVKDARRETRAAWSDEQTRRAGISAKYAAARDARTGEPEPRPMRNQFDAARDPDRARPVRNKTVSLSQPAPAPSPAGDVPPVKRRPAEVPAIDKAAEHAKSQPQTRPPAPPVVVWAKAVAPAPAPTPAKPPAPAFDWGRIARQTPPPRTVQERPPQAAQTQTKKVERAPEPPRPASPPARERGQPFDWSKADRQARPKPAEQKPPERTEAARARSTPDDPSPRQEFWNRQAAPPASEPPARKFDWNRTDDTMRPKPPDIKPGQGQTPERDIE